VKAAAGAEVPEVDVKEQLLFTVGIAERGSAASEQDSVLGYFTEVGLT
jgi:hypothetical protein